MIVSVTIACGDASGPPQNPPASIVVVSGDAQTPVEVGTKLPLPLTAKVLDANGRPVSRITVAWNTNSGTLSAASSVTDANGLASVEWTLGTAAGSQTATARVSDKTAVFNQKAVAGPLTQIVLSRDTVRLLGIGDSFRFNARAADQYGNTVTVETIVESADTSVVTADNFGGGAILTARASDKTVALQATAGMIVKNATAIVLPPPCQTGAAALDLAVGQIGTLSGANSAEFCAKAATADAEFVAIPYYSDFAGGLLRIAISTGGTTIGVSPTRIASSPAFSINPGSQRPPLETDDAFELGLRQRSLEELTPLIPSARLPRSTGAARFNIQTANPQIGDLLKLNTNSSSACTNASMRTGRVVAITDRAIVVADTANPANGFTAADYQSFGAAFDTLVYPVDTLNFGAPTDIDKNQHVILFYTRAVNELTPPQQNFYVGGFFYSRDLFPLTTMGNATGCATSNFAEMFYLLVPDPTGVVNQNVRSVDFVRAVTVATLAHEFQHLINASRHLYVNTGSATFEDLFLDEGLAHEAEELVFYRAAGLSPGQNLDYEQIQLSPREKEAFETFVSADFRRLREYLTNPLTTSPYASNANITTRGAIWSFLRYAADRRGGNETQMWFQLANPPPNIQGVANLTRVVTPDLGSWVRDWAIANYTDDFVSGVQSSYTYASWNMRSAVSVVNQGAWPLTTIPLETVSL
ncbi:MAG TPA: Ig-like domain-containing protein, partial [Gemmatimonadaceae bacterium]|nr:Ig-like domain-containing protein [Gemmatimonadaceae bacterium]